MNADGMNAGGMNAGSMNAGGMGRGRCAASAGRPGAGGRLGRMRRRRWERGGERTKGAAPM